MKVVKGAGKRLRTKHLSARATASLLPYCRIAVVVGKHGHKIVDRNRLRRRLRELVRIDLLPECTNVDIILQALPGAYDADFSVLGSELAVIRRELKLITTGS